jgi:hypothetical protein
MLVQIGLSEYFDAGLSTWLPGVVMCIFLIAVVYVVTAVCILLGNRVPVCFSPRRAHTLRTRTFLNVFVP